MLKQLYLRELALWEQRQTNWERKAPEENIHWQKRRALRLLGFLLAQGTGGALSITYPVSTPKTAFHGNQPP